LIEEDKTYAIICNNYFVGADKYKTFRYWKLDCGIGQSVVLPTPKGYMPTANLPPGVYEGRLIWAIPDSNGVFKTTDVF
jgi:hypothetical protein